MNIIFYDKKNNIKRVSDASDMITINVSMVSEWCSKIIFEENNVKENE